MPKTEHGTNAKNQLFNKYKRDSIRRDIDFNLTKPQFFRITQKNCYYCNRSPKAVFKRKDRNSFYTYNGIDRLNNNIGYTLKNSVPCCKRCNFAKCRLTEQEFLDMVGEVYWNHF